MRPIINTMLDPIVNFGKVTVSTGYSNLDTTIVLSTGNGSKLPNPSTDGSFNLVWFDSSTYGSASDDPNVEIVRCIAITGDTLIIMRAQEGTLASNKNTPAKTYKMILSPTKKTITDIKAEYESGISTHASLDTGIHGVGESTVESVAGSTSKVGTHAVVSTNVHNFDSSGNAPAQTHGIGRHTGTIGDHIANLSSVGINTHAQIDTALTASSGHIATDTGVHGVGISTVESVAGSQAKVNTHSDLTTAHGSTSSATSNTIMQRDASGRSKIAAPSAVDDIARKDTVDTVQTNLNNHTSATTTHGTSGTIVGTTDIQALTNKTITDSTNNVMAKSLKSSTTTIDVSAATAPTTGQVLTATSSTAATWQSVTVPMGSLPAQLLSSYWHATWANATIVQGTWVQTTASLADYDTALTGVGNDIIFNNSGTNLDEIHFGNISLLAGIYKILISYYKITASGIMEILCGTTSLGTINMYGSGYFVSEITVTLPTAINGNLRVRINGKDISSTSYYIFFGRLEILRTVTLPTKILNSYWHASWNEKTVVAGTWTTTADALQTDYDPSIIPSAGTGLTTGSTNNLDEIHFGNITFTAGTYKVTLAYIRSTDTAIVEVLHGTTSIGTRDQYGSLLRNQVVSFTYTPTTTVSGNLRVRANGKNTSSSSYRVYISRLEIIRTA